MRRRDWLVGVALLAGCGADPETSPLAPGTEVVLYSKGDKSTVLLDENRDFVGSIDYGTKLRVIHDPGKPPGHRMVKVLVLEGESKGLRGEFIRSRLRPVPQ